jgi:hypothetical protein
MKKVKLITLAALVAATSMTFTSCGGADEKSDESKDKKGTEATNEGATAEVGDTKAAPVGNFDLETGLGNVQQLVSSLEGGNIVIDKTNSADVLDYYNIVDKYAEEDADRFYGKSSFAGYSISKSFSFYKNQLNNLNYDANFDEGNDDKVIAESDAVYAYLVEVFGKPESRKYPKWETDKYEVSYSTYDNSYAVKFESITVNKYKQDRLDAVVEGSAINNVTNLLTAVTNGTIVLNKTTTSEIGTIANMVIESGYFNDEIQYVDHNLSRRVSSSNSIVSEINYYIREDDPNYENKPTIEADLSALITTTLGADFVTAGEVKTWNKDGYTVTLEDDYSINLTIK